MSEEYTWVPQEQRTHCPQGHPYDEQNTYVPPSGGRYCRICGRRRTAEWRERNRKKAQGGDSA